jgi:HEAT repeat protein
LVVLLAVGLSIAGGCRITPPWRLVAPWKKDDPGPIVRTKKRDQRVAALASLENPEWFRATQAPPAFGGRLDANDDNRFRWRHMGVEEVTAQGDTHQDMLIDALRHDNPVVVANAAVALARLRDSAATEPLVLAATDDEMKLHARLAAIEALCGLNAATADSALSELWQAYGSPDDGGRGYLPELHEELVRGIMARLKGAGDTTDDTATAPAASKVDHPRAELTDVEHRRLATALRSPVPAVRLATLEAYQAAADARVGPLELPAEAVELRFDGDPRVRAATLMALAASWHPQAAEFAHDSLTDTDRDVRMAAIAALGLIGGPDARETLEGLLSDEPELVRVAAIEALIRAGEHTAVSAYAADRSWRVRQVVARGLADQPGRASLALAGELIHDMNPTVQATMIESLSAWPLEQAGPVLLRAIDNGSYLPRKSAARQLGQRWKPAADFPVDAPRETRAEKLAALQQRWTDEFGLVDPAVVGNVEDGVALAGYHAAIGQPASSEAQKKLASLMADLASSDAQQRRQAADRLCEAARGGGLPPEFVRELAVRVEREPDGLVLRSVLMALENDASDAAVALAVSALGHPTGDVRRRACNHLADHGLPEQSQALLATLDDPDPNVVRAAVIALGRIGEVPDTAPLIRLLAAGDHPLRVDVAVALTRMGAAEGPAALERLVHDPDPIIRRQTAQRLGDLGDPAFIATLGPLLDDRQMGVDRAAMESLTKLVGRDVSDRAGQDKDPPSHAERVARWKDWWREEGGRMAAEAPGVLR